MAATPEVHVLQDPQELATEAADLLLWLAERAISARGRFLIALSGGSTPRTLYETLTASDTRAVEWSKVLFFFGDERCVPPSHSESNYHTAQTSLFLPLQIPDSHIYRMKGEEEPRAAAADYESVMRRVFSAAEDPWPRFDLILLGLGDDGHTASLFPGTEALAERKKWVVPGVAPSGVRDRLTVTLDVINRADVILFLVAGPGKASIVREVLGTPESTERYPASLVQPVTGRLLWFLDAAAASALTMTQQQISWREE